MGTHELGHARSVDLVHWQEMPVAIPEDPDYMIFSGSVVVDSHNSSGFGPPGHTPLVAIYTGSQRNDVGIQNQQLAYSNDKGLTWTKYSGNPVLDLGLRNFRDPKVFWYGRHHEWIMAAVLSDQKKVTFYGSPNLKRWTHRGDFGPAGAVDGAWECPDMFVLPVTNVPGKVRWVLKVDVFKGAMVGSGAQYFVGQFSGRTFVADAGNTAQAVDYGKDFYAAASWSNIPSSDGRHLWIGWMNNHEYAQDIPTSPWRGAMSVPREVSLRQIGGTYELLQRPISELRRLRIHHRQMNNVPVTVGSESIPIVSGLDNSAEIVATLEAGEAKELGLLVRAGEHQQTVIGYDVERQRLFIDRSRSGEVDFNDKFAGRQWAPLAMTNGSITLHVLLDRSSVEVFAGDGERVLTEQIFPPAAAADVRAYARGGLANLRTVDLWDLVSMRQQLGSVRE